MITRRHFVARAMLALAAGAAAPLLARERAGEPLYILHTNDTHSRLKPFPQSDVTYSGLGGAARRAHLIRKFRAEHSNVLLLDSGDFFQGTPFFNMFSGEPEIRVMSSLGYDASTLGNHDFDVAVSGLNKALQHAKFPLVSSNYAVSDPGLRPHVKPWIVLKRGGWKVGLFGLGVRLEKLVPADLWQGVTWSDPVESARVAVAGLREQNCDVVVCLSHLGYSRRPEVISDQVIASNVSGIDIILGGHSHTFLDQPEPITAPDGQTTLVAQVGCFGVRLGQIKVSRSRDARVAATGTFQSVCS